MNRLERIKRIKKLEEKVTELEKQVDNPPMKFMEQSILGLGIGIILGLIILATVEVIKWGIA